MRSTPVTVFCRKMPEFVRAASRRADFRRPFAVAVEQMGSKIESKRIAEAAGVPTVPGYHGDAQDERPWPRPRQDRLSGADQGLRGRRRARDAPRRSARDFVAELNAAKGEAEAAFGDNAVLLEKYILNPRHLEVQLAGDRIGNLVHLFERDCSVQRNNQKVH